MKNGRSSFDSLSGSPYLPTKAKLSQTPLKSYNSSKSLHQISGSKAVVHTTPKPQITKSSTKSHSSFVERPHPTPIKNLKGHPAAKENMKDEKDSSIHHNILSFTDTSMTKEGVGEEDIKEDNYIFVCDDYKAGKLSENIDMKYLPRASKQTEKLPKQSDEKSNANKTKIINFNDLQSPQQEQSIEANNFAHACEIIKPESQTIKTEKIVEKCIKEPVFGKEGYLMKRPLIPLGWERIYFRVENLKLYYAPTQELFETKTHVKCLHLLSNLCEIIDEKGQEFSIAAQSLGTVLSLKANSLEEANEWVLYLKKLFSFAQKKSKENKKYIPNHEAFSKTDIILEEEFLATLDTGDVLLLKADHFAAKMQRIFTVSEYDHLALILRNNNEVFLYDSTTENGVQLMSWQDFKQNGHHLSYPTMAYRKLDITDEKLKDEVKQKLWEFVTLHVGKKYELGFKKLFRKPSFSENEYEHPRGSVDLNTTLDDGCIPQDNHLKSVKSFNALKTPSLTSLYRDNDEGFFCSELVAAAYKFSGLLDANISSTRYLPVSFSQRRELGLLGSTLSNEYSLVLLNEH